MGAVDRAEVGKVKPAAIDTVLQAALDGLSIRLAVIDGSGCVVAVNAAWRNADATGGGDWESCGVGASYLDRCEAATGEGAAAARALASGIREVASGRRTEFGLEYAGGSADEARYFEVRVARMQGVAGHLVVTHEETSGRKRAECELRSRALQQQIVADLGQRAMAGATAETLLDEGAFLAAQALDAEYGAVFELLPKDQGLLMRVGSGWQDGCVGHVVVSAGRETQIGYTLVTSEPVIVDDRDAERFAEPACFRDHGIVGGISAVILGDQRPFGVLSVHTARKHHFGIDELHFLQTVANKLAVVLARRRAELALDTSERRFRALIENSLDAVALLDENGTIFYASPATTRVLGWPAHELVGRAGMDLVHSDDHAGAADSFLRTVKSGMSTNQCRIRHKDGSWRWVESVSRNWLADPNVGAIVTNFRDVTERRAAEEARRASEERYRTLVQGLDAIVWEADTATRQLSFVSEGVMSIAGYSSERWRNDSNGWAECIHPGDRAATLAFYQAAVASKEADHSVEYRLIAADGRVLWLRDRFHVVRDADGQARRLRGVMVETTARKLREEQVSVLLEMAQDISGTLELSDLLDRVHKRTARSVGCSAVVTYRWDAGRHRFSPAGFSGISPELVPDAGLLEFDPPDALLDLVSTGQTLVLNQTVDLSWMPAERLADVRTDALVAAPLLTRGRLLGLLVGTRSGTDQPFRTAEIDLLNGIAWQLGVAIETADLYQTQQEEAQVSGALARVGRELISRLDQPDLLECLCRLITEALGCDFSYTLLYRPEDDVYVAAAACGHSEEEWESVRSLKVPAAMLTSLLKRLGKHEAVTISGTGRPKHPLDILAAEHHVTRALHVAIRRGADIIGVVAVGYRGRPGSFSPHQERIAVGVAQLASMALDHTRLVAELERANQLKADFVATMSHELRTPLHIIMGYHDLLVDQLFGTMTPEQLDVMGRIQQSAQGLLELVDATLDVGRLDSGRVRVDAQDVNMMDLIDAVRLEVAGATKKPEVGFHCEVDPALPILRTDPLKLKVILKNIIGNALKFTEEGCVSVRVVPNDHGVEIEVSDTGIGIRHDLRSAIFDPFRQGDSSITRRYGGVGLGLYLVRRLLDVLGGRIEFESEVGKGSTFRIWLPCVSVVPYPAMRPGTAMGLASRLN